MCLASDADDADRTRRAPDVSAAQARAARCACRGKLRMDSTAAPDVGQGDIDRRVLTRDIAQEHPDEIVDYTRDWPTAGGGRRALAGRGNWTPDPQTIVPTLGAHAAVMAVIAAMTAPGDKSPSSSSPIR